MKTLKELKKFTLELTNVSSLATLQKELIEYCEIGEDDSEFVEGLIGINESLKSEVVILQSEVKRLENELDKWPKKDKPEDKTAVKTNKPGSSASSASDAA